MIFYMLQLKKFNFMFSLNACTKLRSTFMSIVGVNYLPLPPPRYRPSYEILGGCETAS